MGLKIKNFQEIFNSLVTWITSDNSKLSDFNVGSALRTMTEAVSLQIEELYFNMKQIVEYAIETAIYSAFGFDSIKETNAYGYVKVRFIKPLESILIIPSDFIVSTSFTNNKVLYYKTTEEYAIDLGATEALIKVTCTESGTIGNCEVGEIDTIITGNHLISSVENIARFTTGVDAESKADMKARFKEYLKSLGRATRESIEYAVKTVDGVAGVHVDDNYIGFVNVYCHDRNGDLPEELQTTILATLDDYRAGGIEVKVLPIVKHPISVTDLTIVVKDNAEVSSIIDSMNILVSSYLNSYSVSTDFFVSDLITMIMNNYASVVVTIDLGSLSNAKIRDNELVVAGDVDIKYVSLSDWR